MSKSKPNRLSKQAQMTLDLPNLKRVELDFDGGQVCSDGGLLILRKADDRLDLCELASYAIADRRDQRHVQHQVVDMIRQRSYGIAAGYEDCNDAGVLRNDAMHRLAVGKTPNGAHALASQPSLSRFEYMADAAYCGSIWATKSEQTGRQNRRNLGDK